MLTCYISFHLEEQVIITWPGRIQHYLQQDQTKWGNNEIFVCFFYLDTLK